MDTVTGAALRAATARLRANSEANMTSLVRVIRRSSSVWSSDNDLTVSGSTVYAGRAKLGGANGPVTYTVGEEVQFYSSATATLPLDVDGVPVDVWVNDLLLVDGADDPGMVGRRFRIVDVEGVGLLPAYRRVQLVGIQRYPGWEDDVIRHPSTGSIPDEIPPGWSV